jgi:hypothetical protein
VYTDASTGAAAAAAAGGEAGGARGAAAGAGRASNGIRSDRDQQIDQAGKHSAAHFQQQHQQKHVGTGNLADPFAAAAARGSSNAPTGSSRLDTSADEPDVAATPWPIGQQAYLAAVKEEPSLQSSTHPSFMQGARNLSSAGWHGSQQLPQLQQQQRQPAAVQQHDSDEGRSECFCKGCVIC